MELKHQVSVPEKYSKEMLNNKLNTKVQKKGKCKAKMMYISVFHFVDS